MRVSYPAILVAAIADFLLAAGWFSLLAKPWVADLRMSTEEIAYYKAHMTPWPYVIAFLGNLILAYGLACVITPTGEARAHTTARGLRYGFGFGVMLATALVTELIFERHTATFMAIAAGYPFLGMIVMGAILGAWKGKQSAILAKTTGV